MKYCLAIGLHNLFFDLAIVDEKHHIVKQNRCNYDHSKDISRNIYVAYNKYFSDYRIFMVGVGVSNNIEFKDGIIYKIKAFNIDRYDLKQSLYKLFRVNVCLVDETYLASLGASYDYDSDSLMYVLIDNKISNSFVIDHELIELEEDIDLHLDKELEKYCCKDAIKMNLLKAGFDDDYIGGYFLSNNPQIKEIIKNWAKHLDKHLARVIKELPVKEIIFGGYLGEYLFEFKEYLSVAKKVNCLGIDNHQKETLIGVSHLIFKDNS